MCLPEFTWISFFLPEVLGLNPVSCWTSWYTVFNPLMTPCYFSAPSGPPQCLTVPHQRSFNKKKGQKSEMTETSFYFSIRRSIEALKFLCVPICVCWQLNSLNEKMNISTQRGREEESSQGEEEEKRRRKGGEGGWGGDQRFSREQISLSSSFGCCWTLIEEEEKCVWLGRGVLSDSAVQSQSRTE